MLPKDSADEQIELNDIQISEQAINDLFNFPSTNIAPIRPVYVNEDISFFVLSPLISNSSTFWINISEMNLNGEIKEETIDELIKDIGR